MSENKITDKDIQEIKELENAIDRLLEEFHKVAFQKEVKTEKELFKEESLSPLREKALDLIVEEHVRFLKAIETILTNE